MNTIKNLFLFALISILGISLSSCGNGTLPSGKAKPDYGWFGIIDGDTTSMFTDGIAIGSGTSYDSEIDNVLSWWTTSLSVMSEAFNPTPQYGFILLERHFVTEEPTIEDAISRARTVTYNWGSSHTLNVQDYLPGAVVYFFDAGGIEWRSDLGTQKSGSFFTITDVIDQTDQSQWAHKISEAEFQCTLYDANGNSKEVTNGSLRMNAFTNL